MPDRGVRVRARAADDIVEIALRIAEEQPVAAARFQAALRLEFERLAAYPRLGRMRNFRSAELRGVRSRTVPGFRNWLVFYREVTDGIDVLRVVHGARDLRRALRYGAS